MKIHLIVFVVFIIVLLRKILLNSVYAENTEKKYLKMITTTGISKRLLYVIFNNFIIVILASYYAYKFANYSWFWLISLILYFIFLFVTIIFSDFIIEFKINKRNFNEEQIQNLIKKRKRWTLIDVVILIMWIFSWGSLFQNMIR